MKLSYSAFTERKFWDQRKSIYFKLCFLKVVYQILYSRKILSNYLNLNSYSSVTYENHDPEKIKNIWAGVPLAFILASIVPLSFYKVTTELLLLYVDYRLRLSLGAINIYQDQLYILALTKNLLDNSSGCEKAITESERKGREKAKECQRTRAGILLFFSY